MSCERQKATARRFAADGSSVVWGLPPPPSPTFAVSPGGVAIVARPPWKVRPYMLPALRKWTQMSRMVVARAAHPCHNLVLLCVYGFPESHPNRSMNEEMLIEAFATMASLTMPAILGGDLNTIHGESLAMVLAEALGILCVSPIDKPTTKSREGDPSSSKPLDYVFANYQAKDLIANTRVNYAISLSDHYPIEVKLSVVKPCFVRVRWPKRSTLPIEKTGAYEFPWLPEEVGFANWQKLATKWLATTFGVKISKKDRVKIVTAPPAAKCDDKVYRQLIKLNLAVQHAKMHGQTSVRLKSIKRKLTALPPDQQHAIGSPHSPDLPHTVEEVIAKYAQEKNELALQTWKQQVATWKVNTKQACAFVRNPPPMKLTMLKDVAGATADPMRIQELLMQYWSQIESWPCEAARKCAEDNLENHYSFLLPHVPFNASLTTELLVDVVKGMKNSASGFDSWTVAEIKALPPQAWDLLRRIFMYRYETMERELVTLVKRVVLEKHDGLCAEAEVRPIDIYSTLLRAISSAMYRLVRPWACQVLYPSQYATQGGALKAVARIAWSTELSFGGLSSVFSVSCDFSKMFNMMSVGVASLSASFMGLSDHLVDLLARPIKGSSFSWKLPHDAKPLEVTHERGLPQGLAGSVLLAECMIAPLLWRCHQVLREESSATTVAYVDDLNFILPRHDMLIRIIELILQYRDHFFLDLSLAKSSLWATHPSTIKDASAHFDIPAARTLKALGAEWPVTVQANPTYDKEHDRCEEAEKRLLRVRHMPIGVAKKIAIISSTCLSTLDYVNHPDLSSVRHLRSLVKKALVQQFAAPEVLYNCFVSSSIDPCIRWLLSGLRLWHLIIQQERDLALLDRLVAGRGRLAKIAKLAEKYCIQVTQHGILVGEAATPPSYPWAIVRSKILEHLKILQLTQLAERRPNTFGGMQTCSCKAHRRFLMSKPDYEQAVLLKLWTGSAMTRAKHAQMGEGSGMCECGDAQDVHHILWTCPLRPPPPPIDCLPC